MAILLTGGAGYIGTHTAVELLSEGYEVVVVDNYRNSSPESLSRVEKITGKTLVSYEADVCDKDALRKIFKENKIDAVIHFAGLKAVGESVRLPLAYYRNNIDSTLSLVEVMQESGCKKLIFSSSATVYGTPESCPITEDMKTGDCSNPYGWTKYMIEQILKGVCVADPDFSVVLLRYFNPVGAHKSGLIGEMPNGIPNNLMPYITQVACGKLKALSVFGDDYDTPDGTGVRDYIHVVDLALGHLAALKKLESDPGLVTYNLGTGKGYSVLDIVNAMSEAVGRPIPYKLVDRRPGDIAACYADPTFAATDLGWTAKHDLADMCRDSWNWQSNNPNGYKK